MGKPEEERDTEKSKTRLVGNVKIDLNETGWRVCNGLLRLRYRWRALENTAMKTQGFFFSIAE
jgi:hypothetical protein